MFQVGVDIGGTFVDFVATDGRASVIKKISSDKSDLLGKVLQGLDQLAFECGLTLEEFLNKTERLVHGNTVAINALLQQQGVKTALIATAGFEDALEIRRSKLANQWNLLAPVAPVLVPRYLRFGLKERINYQGEILHPLELENLAEIIARLQEEQVEAVAVSLLFSFTNPVHERQVKEILASKLPGVFITISSEVSPKVGEYERTGTTVLNACLTPLVAHYLNRLSSELKAKGLKANLQLVQNNGGLADIKTASQLGVKSLLSGPTGGASGGEFLANQLAEPNLIIVDMGGTSFDVSLIKDYACQIIPEAEIAGYPVNLPVIEINSIGTGGGSIASVDAGGRLQVGPQSAEAVPGPACYGRGGIVPTITDAAVVLGFINSSCFGSGMNLSKEIAAQAIEEKVAGPLHIAIDEAALAIQQIGVAKMTDLVHLMTVQKGLDPREFTLVAAGGAAPLFAAEIAENLGIKKVVIPAFAEVFCAQGMLQARVKVDLAQSYPTSLDNLNAAALNVQLEQMLRQAEDNLESQGVNQTNIKSKFSLEIKYADQHHQLPIPFNGSFLDSDSLGKVKDEFHLVHQKNYGYCEPEQECHLVNICLEAWERDLPNLNLSPPSETSGSGGVRQKFRRVCWNRDLGYVQVPIWQAGSLEPGNTVSGPALIEKLYTTIFVSPAHQAYLDHSFNIILLAKEVKTE